MKRFFSLMSVSCALFFSGTSRTLAEGVGAGAAVDAVNQGGVAIFESLSDGGNLLISPYSIQTALAMTYAGAAGETRASMAQALHFPEDSTELAASFRVLDAGLRASAAEAGGDLEFLTANRLFGQKGFEFRKAFLNLLAGEFSAPLEELDYRKNPEAAAEFINTWVEKQTRERIKNLIPEGALTRETTLVLVNALYAMLPWADEFPSNPDLKVEFTGASGKKEVSALRQTARLSYGEFPGYQAVGIPFRGGEFQFLILLPNAGKPLPTEALNAESWRTASSLPVRRIRLTLPKFRLEPPTLPLKDVLVGLGMPSAFDIPERSADFDGMAPRLPEDYLYISNVFHKTFLALDEKGVEAAAATAVVMMRAMAMPIEEEPLEITVDRPFLFAVQHCPTGVCLFLGRLTDPQ